MTSWIDVVGWTLVHFVWEGALIAVIAACLLRFLRASRPQFRYIVACAALAVMLVSPVATALVLRGAPRTALSNTVHVLRSPQGTVLGLAVVPPWASTPATSVGSRPVPRELRLPFELNTDTLFSSMVTLWFVAC
jgi:hypothetical protein